MSSRRLSQTDDESKKAITAGKTKNDTLTEGHEVLSAETTIRINTDQPVFVGAMLARGIALRNQSNSTTSLELLREKAKIYISHFIHAFNNGIVRGVYPQSDRAFYQLDLNSSSVPNISNDENVITWGDNIQIGDPIRVASGGAAMSNPSALELNTVFNAFKVARATHTSLKDEYDAAQKAVADLRPEVNDLILRVWNEVETYYSSEEPANRRRKCREWGIVYVNVSGEVSLTGIVTDINNQPLQAATVTIEQLTVSATTNANGEYSIPTVAAGSYTISMAKTGFQTKIIPNITINNSQATNLDSQLIATSGSLQARITNIGLPLSGVIISIDTLALSAITGSDGIGTINNVSPGTYTITISKPNYTPQTLIGIIVNVGGTTNISADLVSTTGTLVANVYSQGQPLAFATVRIDSLAVQVITGNDGIGRLEALPPNNYNVSAQAPGKVTVTNSIVISANQTASLTFDLQLVG